MPHASRPRWLSDWTTARAIAATATAFPQPVTGVEWGAVNADSFVSLAQFHRVGAFLHDCVADSPDLPAEIRSYSKLVRVRHSFVLSRLWNDMHIVADVAARLNRPCLVLKGPALTSTVYEGRARESSDLDLLIDGRDLSDAIELFRQAGCSLHVPDWGFAVRIVSGEVAIRLPSGILVDLHWHPIHSRRMRERFGIHVANWLERAVEVTLTDSRGRSFDALTLDPTDTINHLCLHACLSGAERVLWFKDIDLAAKRLAWRDDELIRRTRANGTAPLVAAMLRRAAAVVGTELDPKLIRALGGGTLLPTVSRLVLDRVAPPHRQRRAGPDRTIFRGLRATTGESLAELGRMTASKWLTSAEQDEIRPWRGLAVSESPPQSGRKEREQYLDMVRLEVSSSATGQV